MIRSFASGKFLCATTVKFRYRFQSTSSDFLIYDVTAVAVQYRTQIVKCAVNVDVNIIIEHSEALCYDKLINLNPHLFESACAMLFEKKGFQTKVTRQSNDRGADVICFGETKNVLLQVKKIKGQLGSSVVGEVLAAVGFYEERYNCKFSTAIVTNAELTKGAQQLTVANGVEFYGRKFLEETLETGVYLSEILGKERERLKN
ncbi:MAG: hypothetical protein GX130_14330 [Candidatus Hydrogenedens sp.]|nr:hypothetical protein [Candidatus Hydrogenedens sp.]